MLIKIKIKGNRMNITIIALDKLLNTLIKLSDGRGSPDEMLSARAYRLRNEYPNLIKWIDRLFFWDDNHCQECYGIEMALDQLPVEYRGWISNVAQSPADDRDYTYTPPITTVPSATDYRLLAKDIEDQGKIGSCTANSVVSAGEFYLESDNRFTNLSRLFLYYNTRKAENRLGQEGAVLRNALKAAQKTGICEESQWPYIESKAEVEPDSSCYAGTRLLDRYERITIDVADYMKALNHTKAALAEGLPVVFAAYITKQWLTMSGTLQQQRLKYMGLASSKYPQVGAHAMTIVGYDDALDGFIVENSWGTSWGDNGYGVLPYTRIRDAFEIWAIRGFDGITMTPAVPVTYKMPPSVVIDAYHKMGRTDVNDPLDPNVQYWAQNADDPKEIWKCARYLMDTLINEGAAS